MGGGARSELRWAYGYSSSLLHPIFSIECLICDTAFFATEKSSSFSTATNATTTSSMRLVSGVASSAPLISFFVGVYSMLSQWSCSIRTVSDSICN